MKNKNIEAKYQKEFNANSTFSLIDQKIKMVIIIFLMKMSQL